MFARFFIPMVWCFFGTKMSDECNITLINQENQFEKFLNPKISVNVFPYVCIWNLNGPDLPISAEPRQSWTLNTEHTLNSFLYSFHSVVVGYKLNAQMKWREVCKKNVWAQNEGQRAKIGRFTVFNIIQYYYLVSKFQIGYTTPLNFIWNMG